MSVLMAAMHPERVDALLLYGTYARRLRAHDYPWAHTPEERHEYMERLAVEWSWEADMRAMCPTADDAMATWWGQRARAAATPSTVRSLIAMNSLIERLQTTLRDLNPDVQTQESRRALYHDAEPSAPAWTDRTVPLVRQSPGARTSSPAAPGRSRRPCRRCCE